MEEDLKKFMERVKDYDVDVPRTKKYIREIKRRVDNFVECCEGQQSKEKSLEEYLQEYKESLKLNPTEIRTIAYGLSQYNSYKELLKIYKSNKVKLKKIIGEAKEKEKSQGNEKLYMSLDLEEQMVLSMRQILRVCPKISEKDLLITIQKRKTHTSDLLKEKLIDSIQRNINFLDEYSILDSYIEEANNEFKELKLEELTLKKRNPLPDEIGDGKGNFIRYDENGNFHKYDENGKIVNDGEDLYKYEEDIGVLDIFDTENLKKLSVDDLIMIDNFFRAKYFEERIGISRAMTVIKFLDLWPTILNKPEEEIEKITDKEIHSASKRDLALSYLCKNEDSLTMRMKRQYSKFLKENNMSKTQSIKEEIKEIKDEIDNLTDASNNIAIETCLIISKLKDKSFSVKNWGVVEWENDEDNREDETTFAIESSNFRGPLIMSIPTLVLQKFFNSEDLKFPKFKKGDKINERYSNIMSKLYLPVSNYFTRQIKKKYDEDPTSEFYASLVGKKAKKEEKELE